MSLGRSCLKTLLLCALCLAAVEGVCRVCAWHIEKQLRELRSRPDHYYRSSQNPVLAYELDAGRVVEKEGRALRINRFGIRDDSDEIPRAGRVIALLGDSVVFGTGFSQDETISALLQRRLDPKGKSVRVLNFGVPGYNLPELVEFLKLKNAIYKADTVIYLLNPNDFCRRDTLYEGADNGLYRMYRPTRWKSPWFLRKLMYRLYKRGVVSAGWYRWIYSGTRERGLESIREMASSCKAAGSDFMVVLLPAGCAYTRETYLLKDMYDDIGSALKEQGIRVVSPVDAFSADPRALFTDTDHLQRAGNELAAGVIALELQSGGS